MDKEQIERIKLLLNDDPKFIEHDAIFPQELIEFVRKHKAGNKLCRLFKPFKASEDKYELGVYVGCIILECSNRTLRRLNKTEFVDFLSNSEYKRVYLNEEKERKFAQACSAECEMEYKRIQAEKSAQKYAEIAQRKKLEEQSIIKSTESFISQYLNPNYSWNKDVKFGRRFNILKSDLLKCDGSIVTDSIKEMDYYDFLKTPYWVGVRSKILIRDNFKCSLCASKENLAVHHKTYENHGQEVYNLDDLITLCEDCHQHFHKK